MQIKCFLADHSTSITFIFSDQRPYLKNKEVGVRSGEWGERLSNALFGQYLMPKINKSVAFMQKTRNLSLLFLYGHTIVAYRLGLIFLLVVGVCSCGSLTSSGLNGTNFKIGTNVTPIREIKSQPNNQTTVYIQGKVENQAPLMKQWAYQINDSTGKIWVITNQKNLKKGAQVVIKGKVRYRSIPLGGKELGEIYLEED